MMFSYFFFIWQSIKVLHALISRSYKTGLKNIYIVSRIFPYEFKFTKPTFFVLAVVVILSIFLSFTIFIILVSSNKSTGLCPCFVFVLDNQINRCETYHHYQYHFWIAKTAKTAWIKFCLQAKKQSLFRDKKSKRGLNFIHYFFFFILWRK